MKKILITGKNSYVGLKFKEWLKKYPEKYSVDTISLRNDSWKDKDFSGYDAVFHVAGIAHIKETKKNANLYYRVNRDLAYEVARKAKKERVKQLIFLSSMSVYGIKAGVIDKETPLEPKSNYGKSKLEAEKLILDLEDNCFYVAILRPPMIYGAGCKGNYTKLKKLALLTPVFPDIDNKRSMIYIDHFSEYVKCIIDNCSSGCFFPQNDYYINTSRMVELIAKAHGKRVLLTRFFNPILKLMESNETVSKVFGDLTYVQSLSINKEFKFNNFVDLEETIRLTEVHDEKNSNTV